MPNINAGSEYLIREAGFWLPDHLTGKRVTALSSGGGWGPDKVDVRCHCCGQTFSGVDVDKLH